MGIEMTPEQLASAIREGNKDLISQLGIANKSSSGSGGGSGGSSAMPSNAKVQGFGVGLINQFNKLVTGSASAADGLELVTSALAKIPKVGGVAAAAIGAAGGQYLDAQRTTKRGADTGITMSGDIGAFKELAGRSRMTMDQFLGQMNSMGPKMNGLGATMDEAARNTGKISEEFIQSPMGRQLQQMGMSYEELNQITMQYMANRKFSDLSDAKQRKEVNEGLQAFAQNLAENTRITGISTQQQAKNVEGAVANGMVQAKILQMGPEGEAAYRKMRGGLEGFGDDVQKLADEVFTGGIRTKEGTERMAALGPAGRELESAIMAQKNARNAQEKADADARMARAQESLSQYMRSKQFTDQALYQQNSIGQMSVRMLEQNKRIGSQMAGERAAVKEGYAPSQGAAYQKQLAAAGAQGKDPRTGQALPGAQPFKALQAADSRLMDESAGLSKQFNSLNTKLGTTLEKWDVLNSKVLQPRTADTATSSKISDKVTGAGENRPTRRNDGTMLPSRQEGSPGMAGKLLEDWGKGTPAMLHGKEGVFTENQLKDIVNTAGSMSKGMDSQFANLTSSIKSAKMPPMPNIEPPSATSNIQAKLSSMISEMGIGSQAKKSTPAPEKPATDKQTTTQTPSTESSETSTMNELKDMFAKLNSTMEQMLAKSSDMVDMSSQQIRATKKLSGNRFG